MKNDNFVIGGIFGAAIIWMLIVFALWIAILYGVYRLVTSETTSAVVSKTQREIVEWSKSE